MNISKGHTPDEIPPLPEAPRPHGRQPHYYPTWEALRAALREHEACDHRIVRQRFRRQDDDGRVLDFAPGMLVDVAHWPLEEVLRMVDADLLRSEELLYWNSMPDNLVGRVSTGILVPPRDYARETASRRRALARSVRQAHTDDHLVHGPDGRSGPYLKDTPQAAAWLRANYGETPRGQTVPPSNPSRWPA